MIEKPNYIELEKIKELAHQASNLRYDALAHLIDELADANIDKSWEIDVNALMEAKAAFEQAYELSIKCTDSKNLSKHPDTYDEIRNPIFEMNAEKIHLFLRILIRKLNDDAEKDFQRGYKKLCKIILTGSNSAIRSIRKACRLVNLNI